MKRIFFLLFLCICVNNIKAGFYELSITYHVVGTGHHTCGNESRVQIWGIFKYGGEVFLKEDRMYLNPGEEYTNTIKHTFSSSDELVRVKIYSHRKYENGVGNCVTPDGGGGYKETSDFSYPYCTREISGLTGYNSSSYLKAEVKPISGKRKLIVEAQSSGPQLIHLNRCIITNKDLSQSSQYIYFKDGYKERIEFIYDLKTPFFLTITDWASNSLFSDLLTGTNQTGTFEETMTFSRPNPFPEMFPDLPSSVTYTQNVTLNISYENIPKAKIHMCGNCNLTPDQKFTLEAVHDFPQGYYLWEYSKDNIHFQPFPPNLQFTDRIEFTGRELLGNDMSLLKTKIYFRFSLYGVPYGQTNDFYSEIRDITYMKKGPTMTLLTKTNPPCSYENDGGFTIRFGRPLEPGESVNLVIKKGGDTENINNITSESLNGGTDFIYQKGLIVKGYTLKGLEEGEYLISMVAKINEHYTEDTGNETDPAHSCTFNLSSPPPVSGTFSSDSVNCYGGADGRIFVKGTGGTGSYYVFNNDVRIPGTFGTEEYTIGRLSPGTYQLKIYDSNNCEARNAQHTEITYTQTIEQPGNPVALAVEKVFQPRGWGLTDGWIKVRAQNGTAPAEGDYTFYWTQQETGAIPALPPVTEGNSMTNTAENLGDGYYRIRVEDSHYHTAKNLSGATAADLAGCFTELDTFLVQPPKLEMEIATYDTISCFGRADGAIVAHARGGVGGPGTYEYEWKRIEEAVPVSVSNGFMADSISRNLYKAAYVVTVRDTNGITATVDYFLDEPELLTAKILSNTLFCDGDTDGWVEAEVKGGTTPYQYMWTGIGTENATGKTTRIEDLTGGAYSLFITDHHLCEAIATGRIHVPGGMQADTVVVQPLCNDAPEGSISLNVSGGVQPYSYQWNTSENTAGLTGLAPGAYSVRVTDANNCFIDRRFRIINPEPLRVDLGQDMVLCTDQTAVLSARIPDARASYKWYNSYGMFSEEAEVEVSGEGIYLAEVTSGDGCTGIGSVNVSTRDVEISADFVVAAKAAATIPTRMVNISHPFPESTQWILPDDISVFNISHTDEELVLQFNREGEYTVGLTAQVGECVQTVFKTINVVNKNELTDYEPQEEAFLKQFRLWPNPSNGQFTVLVELCEAADVQLRLISSAGTVMETRQLSGNDRYQETFTSNGRLQPGLYIMQLVSKKAVAAIQVVMEN